MQTLKKMQVSNQDYRRKILVENAAQIGETNVRFYAEQNADADPGFFRWLFNSDGGDFELPADATEAYNEFLQTLPTE